ncbi:hypothetical protein ACFVWY_06955 [Streptomyces sp. NPDC058195]|uniref:hypothetical protein n=1 Tax=Streptomyces sp. NPDC058195 TaxID=3346375 RepID=UPI0036E05E49
MERVVVGTVPGEAMFSALRRLAHADASTRGYGGTGGEDGRGPGHGSEGAGPGREEGREPGAEG